MKIMIFLVARLVEFLQCLLLNKNACNDSSPLVSFVHIYLILYSSCGNSHNVNEAMEDIT